MLIDSDKAEELKKTQIKQIGEVVVDGLTVPKYAWGQWGELLTKKQLSDAGYQTLEKLPPIAGVCYRKKSPDGWLRLYDAAAAVPKKKMSNKQKSAIKKAQERSKELRTCPKCGYGNGLRRTPKHPTLCSYCEHLQMLEDDSAAAAAWAKEMVQSGDFLILDTETTGLDSKAEIIEISVIDASGAVLLDTLIKPQRGIPADASAIHGITDDEVKDSPTFPEVYPKLKAIIEGRMVLIYNDSFDVLRIFSDCQRHTLEMIGFKHDCLMTWYAQHYGEWSHYWGGL